VGKTNALRGRISKQHDESIPEAWERLQEYILECPYHGTEDWLLMQTFYPGLTNSARENMDVAARGVFLSLTIIAVKDLIEKMISNQGWSEERLQPHTKGRDMYTVKEVDMLSAKMDLLMKRLEDQSNEKQYVMQIHDSHMTFEVYGNTGHSKTIVPKHKRM